MWGEDPKGKDDLAVANEGIDALAAFIKEMGLLTTFEDLEGVSDDGTLRKVADMAALTPGCTKKPSRYEVSDILVECR